MRRQGEFLLFCKLACSRPPEAKRNRQRKGEQNSRAWFGDLIELDCRGKDDAQIKIDWDDNASSDEAVDRVGDVNFGSSEAKLVIFPKHDARVLQGEAVGFLTRRFVTNKGKNVFVSEITITPLGNGVADADISKAGYADECSDWGFRIR